MCAARFVLRGCSMPVPSATRPGPGPRMSRGLSSRVALKGSRYLQQHLVSQRLGMEGTRSAAEHHPGVPPPHPAPGWPHTQPHAPVPEPGGLYPAPGSSPQLPCMVCRFSLHPSPGQPHTQPSGVPLVSVGLLSLKTQHRQGYQGLTPHL